VAGNGWTKIFFLGHGFVVPSDCAYATHLPSGEKVALSGIGEWTSPYGIVLLFFSDRVQSEMSAPLFTEKSMKSPAATRIQAHAFHRVPVWSAFRRGGSVHPLPENGLITFAVG
jgi:hypothetical protein